MHDTPVIENQDHDQVLDEQPKAPRLDPWHRFTLPGQPQRVRGRIYDDHRGRFADGTWIYTSRVVDIGPGWLQTRNTFYILGRELLPHELQVMDE